MASLDASWLLNGTRPIWYERHGSPELPGRGDACIGSVAQAVARELVSYLVEFAVDVAYGPGTACLGEVLTQVVETLVWCALGSATGGKHVSAISHSSSFLIGISRAKFVTVV